MYKFTKHFLVVLKGIAMGAADVVPGVSGGTIAFLTGIYQTLIESIKSVNFTAIKLFFTGKFSEFWKHINGAFLLPLAIGIGTSIIVLARLMTYLMEHHPIALWSFFFGLILASAVLIFKEIEKWKVSYVISIIIGCTLGVSICLLSPSQTTEELWFIFVCGMVAICAMILPGISGSFILLLMGKYEYILGALNDLKISVILTFMAGAAIGISSFSHFLSWLLSKFYSLTICFLAGIMLGSLTKVWPWQREVVTNIAMKAEDASRVTRPTLPNEQIGTAILFTIIGLTIVLGIEYISKRNKAVTKNPA